MEIIKYRIRNYKAIKDTEIKLNYSINPIIGVNESGKTSILHAILAFDKNRDRVNSGCHLEYQNKYQTKDTKGSKISAYIRLEKKGIRGTKVVSRT
jgi:predicted ATP-dependent endonuclease of OLD family